MLIGPEPSSRRMSAAALVVACAMIVLVAVALATFTSARNHVSSLVLNQRFGIGAYSPLERYPSQLVTVSFRPSRWNRFIVWDGLELDNPYWKLDESSIQTIYGVAGPDGYTQSKVGYSPVKGTRLTSGRSIDGGARFQLGLSRKYMPSLDEWPLADQDSYRLTLRFRFLGIPLVRTLAWKNDCIHGPDPILRGLAGRPIEESYTRWPSLTPSTRQTPVSIARELMSQCLGVYVGEGIYEPQRLAGFRIDTVNLVGQRKDGFSARVEFSVKPTNSSGMWLVGGHTVDADGWIRHCALTFDVVSEDGNYIFMASSIKKPD